MPIDDHSHPISLRDNDPVLADIAMVPPDQYCGPLTERILNAMMDEPNKAITPQGTVEDMEGAEPLNTTDLISDRRKEDILSLEERVKREIAYIGLLDDDPVISLISCNPSERLNVSQKSHCMQVKTMKSVGN